MKSTPALLLAAAAMTAGTAQAYVRTTTDKNAPVRWSRSCVIVTVHTANPPPNLTPELVVTASRAAAATWTRDAVLCPTTPPSGTGFELQITIDDVNPATAANDGKNQTFFRRDAWPYEPSALAITTVFARQDTGVILDADVELNAVDGGRFKWGDLVAGIGTGVHVEDLQNTLTHEYGHLLGLDHNCYFPGSTKRGVDQNGNLVPTCDGAPPDVQEATLFAAVAPGDTLRRTLTADDMAGVCAIYPAASAASCTDSGGGDDGSGGCSFAGGRVPAGGLLAAGLLVSAAIRRRFRRRRG